MPQLISVYSGSSPMTPVMRMPTTSDSRHSRYPPMRRARMKGIGRYKSFCNVRLDQSVSLKLSESLAALYERYPVCQSESALR